MCLQGSVFVVVFFLFFFYSLNVFLNCFHIFNCAFGVSVLRLFWLLFFLSQYFCVAVTFSLCFLFFQFLIIFFCSFVCFCCSVFDFGLTSFSYAFLLCFLVLILFFLDCQSWVLFYNFFVLCFVVVTCVHYCFMCYCDSHLQPTVLSAQTPAVLMQP